MANIEAKEREKVDIKVTRDAPRNVKKHIPEAMNLDETLLRINDGDFKNDLDDVMMSISKNSHWSIVVVNKGIEKV